MSSRGATKQADVSSNRLAITESVGALEQPEKSYPMAHVVPYRPKYWGTSGTHGFQRDSAVIKRRSFRRSMSSSVKVPAGDRRMAPSDALQQCLHGWFARLSYLGRLALEPVTGGKRLAIRFEQMRRYRIIGCVHDDPLRGGAHGKKSQRTITEAFLIGQQALFPYEPPRDHCQLW